VTQPTVEQVIALFEFCRLCGKSVVFKGQLCDECSDRVHTEALESCYDNYGSAE